MSRIALASQWFAFTGKWILERIKVGRLLPFTTLSGKFTTWLTVDNGRRNGSREGDVGFWNSQDGLKSGCFGTCQAVLTMGDVGMTLSSGQTPTLTRILPDFAVCGWSEWSRARLRRRNQTLRDGKESKKAFTTFIYHLPYHSEIINKSGNYHSFTGK